MSEAPSIRPLRWWDIPAAHELEVELFPVDAWSEATFWSELAGVPRTRWYAAADLDGRLAAYGGLRSVGGDGDVQTLAVAPWARGRGLGRALLEALIEEARRRGCAQVLLEVRADNEPAQALYRSRGFERLALRRGYYAPGVDGVVMRLRLAGDGASDG